MSGNEAFDANSERHFTASEEKYFSLGLFLK
jgi:hypothetical protein